MQKERVLIRVKEKVENVARVGAGALVLAGSMVAAGSDTRRADCDNVEINKWRISAPSYFEEGQLLANARCITITKREITQEETDRRFPDIQGPIQP